MTDEQAQRLLEEGRSYFGTPYKWGGNSKAGIDCSGYVSKIYKDALGVNVPRETDSIWRGGTTVRVPQVGDLLLFHTQKTKITGHVGVVYAMNGNTVAKFMHSSGKEMAPGSGPKISDLNNYWRNKIVGFKAYVGGTNNYVAAIGAGSSTSGYQGSGNVMMGTSYNQDTPVGEVYTSDGVDVLSGTSPYANSLNTSAVQDSSAKTPDLAGYDKFKFRIYQEFKPTIAITELSLPETEHSYDASTASQSTGTSNTFTEPGANVFADDDLNPQTRSDTESNKGSGMNTIRAVGKEFPLVRIRDKVFHYTNIKYFELDHTGFVPMLTLDLWCTDKSLIKDNIVQEGSICSIYINEDLNQEQNIILPIRADFRILRAIVPDVSQVSMNQNFFIHVVAELNVPSLHSCNNTFAFSGSTRDALRDAAKKLSLGFCFNNPNNTDDAGMWQCQPTGTQGMDSYITELTQHAWIDENRFFDSWIDPRYNLTFIDINQQLGFEGVEPDFNSLDVAMLTNNMDNAISADGNKMIPDNDITKTAWWAKMFTNLDSNDINTRSPFKVMKYNVINESTSISREIGLLRDASMELQNSGISAELSDINIGFKLAYNHDKVKEGDPTCKFYILDGPGADFHSGPNQSASTDYAKNESFKAPSVDLPVQSDNDAQEIAESGSNEFASGNVPKTYLVAMEHNLLNNLQLQKQYISLSCIGLNLQILRGEKVPVIMLDKNQFSRFNGDDRYPAKENPYSRIDPTASGWFIISGIKWIWQYNSSQIGAPTSWITEVRVTRREWPIPVPTVDPDDGDAININISDSSNTFIESKQGDEGFVDTPSDASVPNEGLRPYLQQTWDLILAATNNKVKMKSGKRWAADKDWNKVEGNAFYQEGDQYRVIDTDGSHGWEQNANSLHLFGQAIQFSATTEDIANIALNGNTIMSMFDNGLSIEKVKSLENTYVLSTSNSGQDAWWKLVAEANNGNYTLNFGSRTINLSNYGANKKDIARTVTNTIVRG